MKKIICLLLTLILTALTTVPVLSASAAEADEAVELTDGTYASGQVVVMFKNSVIDNETVPKKGDIAAVGADFGENLRLLTDKLDSKSFYAFNPSFDKKCFKKNK